jgi:hypothetical protein
MIWPEVITKSGFYCDHEGIKVWLWLNSPVEHFFSVKVGEFETPVLHCMYQYRQILYKSQPVHWSP